MFFDGVLTMENKEFSIADAVFRAEKDLLERSKKRKASAAAGSTDQLKNNNLKQARAPMASKAKKSNTKPNVQEAVAECSGLAENNAKRVCLDLSTDKNNNDCLIDDVDERVLDASDFEGDCMEGSADVEGQHQEQGQAGFDYNVELDYLLNPPADNKEEDDLLVELKKAYAAQVDAAGPPINKDFGELINGMFSDIMPDEKVKTLLELYVRPENCPNVVSARVNQEVWDGLSTSTRISDIALSKVGAKIVKGATPVIRVVDGLYQARRSGSPPDISNAIRGCMDALAIIGNAVHELNVLRRSEIKKDLPPRAQKLVGKVQLESPLLFGEDLHKQIKDVAENEKLGLGFSKKSGPRFNYASSNYPGYVQSRGRGSRPFFPARIQSGEGRWGTPALRARPPFMAPQQGYHKKPSLAYRSGPLPTQKGKVNQRK